MHHLQTYADPDALRVVGGTTGTRGSPTGGVLTADSGASVATPGQTVT